MDTAEYTNTITRWNDTEAMSTEIPDQPDLTCQWCGGTIPADSDACTGCGAVRPREDLRVPGGPLNDEMRPAGEGDPLADQDDDAARARKILREMDAYVDEDTSSTVTRRNDPTDDAIVIIGILVIGGVVGGLAGWMLAPPLLHDLFEGTLGIESEGPEAFRRMGAFVGALIAMLMGGVLATMIRR